jgi:DNA-binding transcriptional MerR regulator
MPLSRSRDYLSIGEVLETIREDFPDVSVSKIRFLEAEGLISPERTGSGYRKFYEPDVKRLRYILSLQRDQFLPLKVIKDRLSEFDANGGEPVTAPRSPVSAPSGGKRSVSTTVPATDVSLSRSELLKASGLSQSQLEGLEEFSVMPSRTAEDRYDGNDLAVAKAALGLFEFGVEPRHLRMYRQLADREVNFVEQIVSPVARRKDKDSQQEAARSAFALLDHSRRLRDALVQAEIREVL